MESISILGCGWLGLPLAEHLIKKGYKVKSLDIQDLFWMDVDYPSDLFKARFNSNKFLKKPYPERILRVVDSN